LSAIAQVSLPPYLPPSLHPSISLFSWRH
jgi:hypothetical protein